MTVSPFALILIIVLGVICFTLLLTRWREPQGTSVPPAEVAATGRRQPPGMETPAVPGGAPGAGTARPGAPAPGNVPHKPRHAATRPRFSLVAELNKRATAAHARAIGTWYPQRLVPGQSTEVAPTEDAAPWDTSTRTDLPVLADTAAQYHSMPAAYGQAPVARVQEGERLSQVIA